MTRRDCNVEFLIAEWEIGKSSPQLQACMRKVLGELAGEAQMALRDPRLQIAVLPEAPDSAWAYFPIHRMRSIVRDFHIDLKQAARVLLVISEKHFKKQPGRVSNADLRDHLGHTLLYLHNPKAQNDCNNAMKEWRQCRSMAAR
jgi:hypothetical protein